MKSLDAWLDEIRGVHPKSWDPGLDRVGEVGRRLDVLRPAQTVITVAGTNGKGSTVEFLAELSRASGKKTGKATSPFFLEFNEQIQIDGENATDEDIVSAFELIDSARGDITLTYFEYSTLASLILFQRAGVDVAVLEIGLGGRLDAFNIADPDISVITQLALDHQDWLGNTIEEIAREKAGIMRCQRPCVVAEAQPPAALLAAGEAHGAVLVRRGLDFCERDDGDLVLSNGDTVTIPSSLHLPRQSAITAVQAAALAGCLPSPGVVHEVLARTTLPGRYQHLLDGKVILDVAHNPNAAAYLADKLSSENLPGKLSAVCGMYADKDMASVMSLIGPFVSDWHLVSADDPRAASTDQLRDALGDSASGSVHAYAKVIDAYNAALSAAEADDKVLVFGSFPVVAAVLGNKPCP